MKYYIDRIQRKEDIEHCEKFEIRQYMWDSKVEPVAYGFLGYLEGQGLFVKMICEESNPKREHKNHRERVCEDSAMEIFLAFAEEEEILSNDCMYLNFEFNANGAMYVKYGKGRKNRQFITEEQSEMIRCKATIEEDRWSIEAVLPELLLREVCDFEKIKNGNMFYFNFYKISESDEILHFGSYSPIEIDTPNFHVPIYFAETQIR